MSLIKLCMETSVLSADPKDPRLLPMTERQKPQIRKKPNVDVMNMGMNE